ncbi:DUF3515 domain-containing protein [Nocardia sp. NPDC049149]|uniref:DUF3515 domain-containing protein n=1 Tax=Nocardia sp. NPDC049149 TaxID=3364315 RepID=UPI0037239E60
MAAATSDRDSSKDEASKDAAEEATTHEDAAESATETAADAAETDEAAADEGTAEDTSTAESTRQYSPALIATAVALPVMLVVGVLVAAVVARNAPVEREPLVLGPVAAPAATGTACTTLLPQLPVTLGEFSKSTLVEPSPPATWAWQREDGGDPIVLRCGLDRPLEFNRASALQIVNGVQWFEARDQAAKASTWFAVDRETYIALTVPDGSGPTPLQGISDAITANLPATPIDPGPLPN